jgi:hypothetical protein
MVWKEALCFTGLKDGPRTLGFGSLRGNGLLLKEPRSRRHPPVVRFKVWGKTASCSLDLKDDLIRLGFRGWPPTLEDLESLEDGLLLWDLSSEDGLQL